MKARWFAIVAAWIAAVTLARADGLIIIPNPPTGVGRPGHPSFAPLEVVFHKVDVTITGQRAVTRVEQEFHNPNNAVLEGEYLFPIPKGAHLDKFTMRIGDKDMEAELLDAAKARGIYEDIVRRQKDPALLEYTGRAAFRVRIFPIEPRSTKKVSLTYSEIVPVDAGVASYTYPLNTEKFSAAPLRNVSVRVTLDGESPLKTVYSPSHPVDVRRDGDRRAVVGWEESNARPDTDFQLLYATSVTEVGLHLVTHRREGEDGWFLLLASPGEAAAGTRQVNPKDVVFVVDTSGSMAGKKIEQARRAMAYCVENLNDNDRFEVLRFSTDCDGLFDGLHAADKSARKRALDAVEGWRPKGGTAIADALRRALSLRETNSGRPHVVVFLTDGQPTVGETSEDKIVASVGTDGGPVRVFCFGIGTDINTHLLDRITERTRAASQYVLPEEDIEVKVSSFFAKVREPMLTDLSLTWPEGVKVTASYPSPLPDLFRGGQLVVAGRYSGTARGPVVLEGRINGETRRMTGNVEFAASSDRPYVAQLWAIRRVGWLLDEIRLRGESAELRDEVTDLARRFAIVTPYTSYLIVEDEARRGVASSVRTLGNFANDRDARAVSGTAYRDMSRQLDKDGYAGAFNGRVNGGLKEGMDAQAIARSRADNSFGVAAKQAGRSAGAGARPALADAAPAAKRLNDALGAVRQANGKTFTQNGAVWNDTTLQAVKEQRRRRVQFATKEYFDLLTERPETTEWLALGRNVQFAIGDTVYEIFE
jgi:Ca-activated chloride channel family protein